MQTGSGTYNINGLNVTVNLYCNDNCGGHRSYIQKDAIAFAQAQFVGIGTLEPRPDCSNSFYLITVSCPSGQVINSTKDRCVDANSVTTDTNTKTNTTDTGGGCLSGQTLDPVTNKCISNGNNACANGATDTGTCKNCPSGEKLNSGNVCVCANGATDPGICKSCPSGKCLVGGVCSSAGTNYCQAGNIVNSCGLVTECVGGTTCQMAGGVAACISNASGQNMLTLTASPSQVQAGGRCTLNWDTHNATSCILSGVGINNQLISLTTSGAGSMQGGVLNSSATYTMTCSDGTQTVKKTAVCSVIPTVIEN